MDDPIAMPATAAQGQGKGKGEGEPQKARPALRSEARPKIRAKDPGKSQLIRARRRQCRHRNHAN